MTGLCVERGLFTAEDVEREAGGEGEEVDQEPCYSVGQAVSLAYSP